MTRESAVTRHLSNRERIRQFERHMEANEAFKLAQRKRNAAYEKFLAKHGKAIATNYKLVLLLIMASFAPRWRDRRNARRRLKELAREANSDA